MEQREIVVPYELNHSDLISLSSYAESTSSDSSSVSTDEIERLAAVSNSVMENLGPTGPGLIAVTGVPSASELRHSLLPLARCLALLNQDDRKRILKEHNLGSDVPLKNLDRLVSSFAMQLKYKDLLDSSPQNRVKRVDGIQNMVEEHLDVDKLSISNDQKFKNLGSNFRELGFRMMDVGLSVARICDRAIGGQVLEDSLLDSGTAKCRLIHYHSDLDTRIIRESERERRCRKNQAGCEFRHSEDTAERCSFSADQMRRDGSEGNKSRVTPSALWQQWHYDYGTFTVLTSPMFTYTSCSGTPGLISCSRECPSPSGQSYLQIYDPNKNKICIVKAPPESFIVQVGESANIFSSGKLRATLHSVCRPPELDNLSRETFVVFLQPAWDKVFDISGYPLESLPSYDYSSSQVSREQPPDCQLDLKQETHMNFHKFVPPLSSRLRNGMTFAEFSRETTKQYYGGNGLQSNR